MRAGQAFKRGGLALIGLVVFYPFLVALVCWLMTLWQTYLVLLIVSVVCFRKVRGRLGSGAPQTRSRGSLERVPYEPALGPIASEADDWES